MTEAIEMLHRDHLGEQLERLAHHALRGELREKAVGYLRQAGLKAAGRSALDARLWLEQAIAVLASLPESPSTLEQAFDIRLELWPVLGQLAEIRHGLERLREAEPLAERLNDDRRRGQVYAFMTNIHTLLGEPDEALASGTRALEIAERLADLTLRIPATSYLEQAHHFQGEHQRVVGLAIDNLTKLPADWVYEDFGLPAPPSVWDRCWLIMSLAELGIRRNGRSRSRGDPVGNGHRDVPRDGYEFLAGASRSGEQGIGVIARHLVRRTTLDRLDPIRISVSRTLTGHGFEQARSLAPLGPCPHQMPADPFMN